MSIMVGQDKTPNFSSWNLRGRGQGTKHSTQAKDKSDRNQGQDKM